MKTKNVLSFIIAIVFALSVCPLFTYAKGIDELVLEDVTGGQPAYAIASDLSLPAGYTWTSSDDGIISIGEEQDGVISAIVARSLGEDKAVTLTATNGQVSESFNLVVKSKEMKVIAAGTSAGGVQDVFTEFTDEDKDVTNLSIKQEVDGNYYQEYNFTDTDDGYFDRHYLTSEQSELIAGASVVTFEFDFKYAPTTAGAPVDFRIDVGDGRYKLAGWSGSSIYLGERANNIKKSFSSTDWNHVILTFDTYTGTVEGTIGDTFIGTSKCYNESTVTQQTYLDNALKSKLSQIGIIKGSSRGDCGTFSLDNVCVYASMPGELSQSEQKEFIENIKWSDLSSANAAIMENGTINLDTYKGLVNWAATGDVISLTDTTYTNTDASVSKTVGRTAVITRPGENLSESIILTATHKDGADKGEKVFNILVMPESYSADLTTATSTSGVFYEDFEEGVSGETVLTGDTTTYSDVAVSKWGMTPANKANFTYKLDPVKGMVGKISGEGKQMTLKSGVYSDRTGSITSVDIKFNSGSQTNSEVSLTLTGATKIFDVRVLSNKIRIFTSDGYEDYEVSTDGWINIAVESNFASRTNNLYINGEKLNELPLKSMSYTTKTGFGGNQRTIDLKVTGTAEVLMDNIASIANTNVDEVLAQAGVQAAQVYYNDAFLTGTSLPATGPEYVTSGVDFANEGFAMDGGATLAWSGENVANNTFSPLSPAEYTLTVTSVSNEEIATGEINVTAAPVIINVDEYGNVNLSGNTESGVLIVATMDGDKLAEAKVYTSFENINVANIESYKLIFINSFSKLTPLAYSISK